MPTITDDFVKTMNKKFKKTNYRPWDERFSLDREQSLLVNDEESPHSDSGEKDDLLSNTKKVLDLKEKANFVDNSSHDVKEKNERLDNLNSHVINNQNKIMNSDITQEINYPISLEPQSKWTRTDISSEIRHNDIALVVMSLFGIQKRIMELLVKHIDNGFLNDHFIQTLPVIINDFSDKVGVSCGTVKTSFSRLRKKGLIQSHFYKRGRGGLTIFLIKIEVVRLIEKFR